MNILVTEPSPELPTASPNISSLQVEPSSTLVHVLVHRESEEYEDNGNASDKGMFDTHD